MKKEIVTACPLDCWDACSVLATVEDGRVTAVRGNPAHPITRGFLCEKTMRYPQRAYSPNRILFPLLRREGDARTEPDAFDRISWDQALDLAAAKIAGALAAGGPHSLLHFQSAGSMGMLKKLGRRFFNLLGGATEPAGDICFGAGELGMERTFGEQTAHSPEDIPNSRLVLLWGRDPFISNTHLVPFLKEAKRRGCLIAAINPKRIDRSGMLDWQLQPLPGSDVFLALAMLREFIARDWSDAACLAGHTKGWAGFAAFVASHTAKEWLEPSGIHSGEFERLLAAYRERRPAAIWIGSGLQHNRLGVEVVEALGALTVASGNSGVPGGGLSFFPKHRKHFDLSWATPRPEVRNREIPVGEFWKHLPGLDPPVAAMWINGANPVRALPDSRAVRDAIRSIPFVVAVDFHWTDTVRCADLVLPHVSFLEEGGLVSSYGHNYVALQQPAAPPVGEARTDLEIFQQLAARLGIGDGMEGTEREWVDRFMAPLFAAEPGLREKFFRDGFVENPLMARVPNASGEFYTPDGKFHFPAPMDLGLELPARADSQYPLRLLTFKSKRHLLSQHAAERESERCNVLLHPRTASRFELLEGQTVSVESVTGSVAAWVRLDDGLREDVAAIPLGGSLARGTSVNLLTRAVMAGDGACPAYNDTFVRVAKLD